MKHPSTNIQPPENHQTSNIRLPARSCWSLLIGISLVLGAWNLVLPSCRAQLQMIDLTSPQTNITVNSALLTIPSLCTNTSYTVSNPAAITLGDSWNTAGGKINSNFAWTTNEINLLFSLENITDSNWVAAVTSMAVLTSNTTVANLLATAGLNTVSNHFVNVSNTMARFLATNVPGDMNYGAPIMADYHGGVTNIESDGFGNLTNNGSLTIVGGPSSAHVFTTIANDSVGTMNFTSGQAGSTLVCKFAMAAGAASFYSQDTSSGTIYGDLYFDAFGTSQIQSAANGAIVRVNGGGTVDLTDASGSGAHLDGSGDFNMDIKMSSDSGAFYSDGSGNVTCNSLTETSDANTKTNIVALDSAGVLQKLLAIPVFRWNFRDFTTTNYITSRVSLPGAPSPATNTETIKSFSSSSSSSSSLTTNTIIKQHILSNVTHYGPMAQDWSARFGGRTNGISVIDMQGLLLAGIQALSQQTDVFTNANGAKFHLVVNAATNGFVFVAP